MLNAYYRSAHSGFISDRVNTSAVIVSARLFQLMSSITGHLSLACFLMSILYESWNIRGWLTCLIHLSLEFPGSIRKVGFTLQHTLLRSKDLLELVMLLKQGFRAFSPSEASALPNLIKLRYGPNWHPNLTWLFWLLDLNVLLSLTVGCYHLVTAGLTR